MPCTVYNSKVEGCQQNKVEPRETARRMGRTRRDEPTRELVRLSRLIVDCEHNGLPQAELAALTGLKISYLNQIRNYDKYGKTGVGAEIVRLVMKGLGIEPEYFFGDYEGDRPYTMYLLSAKRDEKRVTAIEQRLARTEQSAATSDTVI
ncbi:XRE family transcriptional regulator, partial [bacterium]